MSMIAPLAGYVNPPPLSSSVSTQDPKSSAITASSNTPSRSNNTTSSPNVPAGWDSVTTGGLRAQITVNGVVVGVVYNNGVTVLNDKYAKSGMFGGTDMFGGSDEDNLQGPQLADYRLAKLKTALQGTGAKFEMLPTAISLEDWFGKPGRHVNQTA